MVPVELDPVSSCSTQTASSSTRIVSCPSCSTQTTSPSTTIPVWIDLCTPGTPPPEENLRECVSNSPICKSCFPTFDQNLEGLSLITDTPHQHSMGYESDQSFESIEDSIEEHFYTPNNNNNN